MDISGLVYPDAVLAAAPVLHDSPANASNGGVDKHAPPIRALSASQFADFHLQHTTAHPPDNVLFPFLHGLEGDNHAQNTFFASSSMGPGAHGSGHGYNHHHHHHHNHHPRITPRLPKYRGLVWVVCEDDLEKAGDNVTLRILRRKPVDEVLNAHGQPTPSSSSDDSSSEFDEDELDEDEEMMMMEEDDAASASSSFPGDAADLDVEVDGDDLDSVLASPLLSSPMSMQVDDVHVVSGDADDRERGSIEGIPPSHDVKKDERHYEGTHMHPVSHRPAVGIAPPPHQMVPSNAPNPTADSTPNPATGASPLAVPVSSGHLTHGLGINTNVPHNPPLSSFGSLTTPSSVSSSPTSIFDTDTDKGPSSSSSVSNPASPLTGVTTPTSPSASDIVDLKGPSQHLPPFSTQPAPALVRPNTNPASPPLITSTFRPKELLRRTKGAKAKVAAAAAAQAEAEHVKQVLGLGRHPLSPPSTPSKANFNASGTPAKADHSVNGHQRNPSGASARSQHSKGAEHLHHHHHHRQEEDEGWEFVPARVPDGISLRNFGVQVVSTLTPRLLSVPHLHLSRLFYLSCKAMIYSCHVFSDASSGPQAASDVLCFLSSLFIAWKSCFCHGSSLLVHGASVILFSHYPPRLESIDQTPTNHPFTV